MWYNIKSHCTIPIVIIMCMLVFVYPCVINYFIGLPGESTLIPIFLVLTAIMSIALNRNGKNLPSAVNTCMIIQAITWFIMCIYHADSSYLTRLVFLATCFFSILMLIRADSLNKFIRVYGMWFAIQAIGAAVAFALILNGVLKPLSILFLDDGRVLYNFGITCTNSLIGNFSRPAGFFDEPGALACWGMFFLLINKLTYANKRIEIICMIGLLFTWSAAYFVLLTMYFTFFHITNAMKSFLMIILLIKK